MKYVLVNDNLNQNNSSNLVTLVVVVALFVWLVLPTLRKMCKRSNKPTSKVTPKVQSKQTTKETFESMTNVENDSSVEPSGLESPSYGYIPASVNESMYLLSDGANNEYSYEYNKCSPACCADTCTSVPTGYEKDRAEMKDKYVLTNQTCNSSFQSTGCLCATKKQQDFLANRGGNN